MSLNCSLCNLEFKNDDQLKQHLDGKRHKKLETIKEERESSAKRSLFVSGLKKDTFIKQLEEHFIQFGKINKIVTDHEKNAYAIIEFENEQSVQSALNSQEHKVNGKNLKISRREMKEFVSKIVNNGDKKKEILEKLKEEALIVNTLLGKCSSFDEQIDKLIEYFKLNDDEMKQREEICEKLNDIFKQFWNQDEFKVNIFGSTLTSLACKGSDMDMSLLFNQYLIENQHKQVKLPKIIVKQLKQSNGQDSSDSNMAEAVETELDEDIDLDEANENNDEEEKTLKESIKTFFNDKDYKKFLKFDIEHQIKIVAKIIQRFYYDIKNLKTITNTRCPVVRFFHDKANINCDLSLNNFLAYENSKLLMVYLNLEPNLSKLIYVLRYWFKQKNLYSTSKFNSYTIIWLIIFYMQTKNIGYLPTVDYLSKITNKVNEIHGWNCSFEDDINKIKSMKPQSNESTSQIDINSLNDLLKGFFDFYSTFQFTSQGSIHNIICTRNTQLIQTDKSELTKLSSFINIQDPFDLSHNLSANISKSTMEKFLTECKGSNDLLQYSCPPRRSANKGWGLILLTTKKSLPITHNSVNNNQLIEKSLLTLKLVDNESEKEELEEISVRKAIDFVMYLLTDCLQFEKLDGDKLIIKRKKRLRILNQICDQVDSLGLNCSPKRLKTNNNTSNDPNKPSSTYVCVIDESLNNNGNGEEFDEKEDENNKVVASYQLCAKENTWQGRRAVKRELKQKNENLNELVLEKMTSERLKSIHKSQSHTINFRIQFSYNPQSIDKADSINANKKNLSHLNIKFDLLDDVHNQNDLIDFTTLVHFLDVYINNCQEKLFTQWNTKASQSN